MENNDDQKVNYIQHLLAVCGQFNKDDRLSALHISLYYTLFHSWNLSKFRNPISICREEVMQASKIGSANTYTKCLKDLHNWQYLKYMPSFNPHQGSKIYMYKFNKPTNNGTDIPSDKATDKASDKASDKGTDKATVKAVIPSINSINNTNSLNNTKRVNRKSHSKKNQDGKNNNNNSAISTLEILQQPSGDPGDHKNQKSTKKEKKVPPGAGEVSLSFGEAGRAAKVQRTFERASKQDEAENASERFERPLLQHIQNYFAEKNWPAIEAEKYYNHYQSNGWLVGGKTPMVNWQASAEKWMLNSKNFMQNHSPLGKGKELRLHISNEKNYNEPL